MPFFLIGYSIGNTNRNYSSTQLWRYDDGKYVWIGGDREVVFQQGQVLDAVKHGTVVRFTLSVPFHLDVCTGRLTKINNDGTTQEWQYDPNDHSISTDLPFGTYEYMGTIKGKNYDENAGFKAWPKLNGN